MAKSEDLARWLLMMAVSVSIIAPVLIYMNQSNNGSSVSKDPPTPSVLVMLDTSFNTYHTNLAVVRNTWLRRVLEKKSMHVIIVGSKDTDDMTDVIPSQCPKQSVGNTCKRAEMSSIAVDYLKSAEGKGFNWVIFLQDDMYLLPDNLQRIIVNLGYDSAHERRAWGAKGCGYQKCGGFCGGGGWLTNRDTLIRLHEEIDHSKYSTLIEESKIYENDCGDFGDLVMARLFEERRNVATIQYPGGHYVWGFANGDRGLVDSLRSTDPIPWLYDIPASQRFEFLHQKATELGSSKPFLD